MKHKNVDEPCAVHRRPYSPPVIVKPMYSAQVFELMSADMKRRAAIDWAEQHAAANPNDAIAVYVSNMLRGGK